MTWVKALLADRSRRQRGSVLSGVLIIVAMLAILIGALTTQLSSAFWLTKAMSTKITNEATVNSAVELALANLKSGPVAPVCATYTNSWSLTLNGKPATVRQTCSAIVPDQHVQLDAGSYSVDGFHEAISGINDYVVGDQSGLLRAYRFGTPSLHWSLDARGAITAPAFAMPDGSGHVSLLVPNTSSRATCGGHCVTLYQQQSGTPSFQCDMAAGGAVNSAAAAEVSPSGFTRNFPGYTFFGDASGRISVYDASTNGNSCALLDQDTDQLGAPVVGQPLVFTGTVTTKKGITTSVADIFVVTSSTGTTWLEHWQYVETTGSPNELYFVQNYSLGVGGRALVSAPNSPVLDIGSTVSQVVAGLSGGLRIVRVSASSSKNGNGPIYTMSLSAASGSVPASVTSAPFWCGSACGDLIGVGSTNHVLYVLNTALATRWTYTAPAAINTTPVADVNGDWYFGADDGYVYDVEIPATGSTMFNAARFGPIGPITSSPIEAPCSTGPCIYFASTSSGYFVQLGSTRTSDLRACISPTVDCTGAPNPRLWARATIGGTGISVQGWSYYSP